MGAYTAAVDRTTTGTAVATPVTVTGILLEGAGTAGTVVVRDGGGSGTVRLTLSTPAVAGEPLYIQIPGGGLVFSTDVHLTITTTARVTVFHEV